MKEITIERAAVNVEALDAALRAALGSTTSGFSIAGGKVVVYLVDTATPQQETQARQLVQNHNPAQLTPAQQAAVQRQERLNQARSNYAVNPLDVTAYNAQTALIQQLAQKISWLEQEIVDVRGGSVA